jgi:hypothetical protein
MLDGTQALDADRLERLNLSEFQAPGASMERKCKESGRK